MNGSDQQDRQERQRTEELASRARRVVAEVLNGEDGDAMAELLADDVVVHGLGSGEDTKGVEAFAEGLAAWRVAVPDSEDTVDDAVAEGDTVVLFCTRRGTLESEYPGVPAGAVGNSFEIVVVHKFRFEDWRVAEWWRLADALGMARQLGALPESPGDAVRFMVGGMRRRLSG